MHLRDILVSIILSLIANLSMILFAKTMGIMQNIKKKRQELQLLSFLMHLIH